MGNESDATLLKNYTSKEDQGSFSKIVSRHTNLVFSAVARQVGTFDIAADITQEVFIALAQNAPALVPRLSGEASLAGWLCRSAHFLCLNFKRDEYRRQLREREAMELLSMEVESGPDWMQLGPVLDEEMSRLGELDYDALVMRFYNGQTLAEVGAALGSTEDAAQKRVNRALEKLRKHLSRRGIKTSVGALSLVISTHALQSAPIGLAASINAAAALAGAALPASTIGLATPNLAMTTLHKTMMSACFVVAAGVVTFECLRPNTLSARMATASRNEFALEVRVANARQENARALIQLTAARVKRETYLKENDELKKLRTEAMIAGGNLSASTPAINSSFGDGTDSLAEAWAMRARELRERIEAMPDAKTPELPLVGEQDWLAATKEPFLTDADFRRAVSQIRAAGELKVAIILQKALKKFILENGDFPTELNQLQADVPSPLSPGILDKWEIISANKRSRPSSDGYSWPGHSGAGIGLGGNQIIVQKDRADKENDPFITIGQEVLAKTHNGSTTLIQPK